MLFETESEDALETRPCPLPVNVFAPEKTSVPESAFFSSPCVPSSTALIVCVPVEFAVIFGVALSAPASAFSTIVEPVAP